ncbi:MAG: hypothetical protein ACP5QR_03385 [Rhizomicrobium sp.]
MDERFAERRIALATLFGFAPFIIFSLVTLLSLSLGLWLAFTAAFVITIRDFVETPRLRLLDGANLLIFGGLALVGGFLEPNLRLITARLAVEGTLFGLALFSIASSKPLSLAYHRTGARRQFSGLWRSHLLITAAWALAVLMMGVADAVTLGDPNISISGDFAFGLAALGAVIVFTLRFPHRPVSHGRALPHDQVPAIKSAAGHNR